MSSNLGKKSILIVYTTESALSNSFHEIENTIDEIRLKENHNPDSKDKNTNFSKYEQPSHGRQREYNLSFEK